MQEVVGELQLQSRDLLIELAQPFLVSILEISSVALKLFVDFLHHLHLFVCQLCAVHVVIYSLDTLE